MESIRAVIVWFFKVTIIVSFPLYYDNSIIADHGKKKRQTVCLVHCPIPFPWNASKPVNVMKYGLGFRYACLGPLEVADLAVWTPSPISAAI